MRLIVSRFLIAGLMVGSLFAAETYKFQIADKVMVGSTELKPGKYQLEVDGNNAVLKDKSGKAIEAKAKVEQTPNKANVTFVGISGDAGAKKLASIVPAGGQVRVTFE